MDDDFQDSLPYSLTDRERRIVEYAADRAVKKMVENFYSEVGRTVIGRFLIIVGAAVVSFMVGKGAFKSFLE